MAKAKLIELDDETIATREVDDVEESILTEFRAGEGDVTFSIKVYAVPGNQRAGDKELYLFTIDPSDLPIDDRLRDQYGSGTYRARVYRTEDGKRSLYRQFDMHILAPEHKPETTNSTSEVISSVRQMMQEFREEIRRTTPVAAQAPLDPIAMMTQMSTIFSNMARGPAPQPSPPSATPEKMFDLLTQGIELGKTLAAGGVDDVSVMGIIKEIVKAPEVQGAVGNAISTMFANRTGQVPPTQQSTAQISAPQNQTSAQNDPRAILTNHLNYLSGKAAASKPIPLYVDWFLDNTPPETVTQLLALPNLLEQLEGVHLGVKANREWFANFIDDVRVQVQPPPEEHPSEVAPNADGAGPVNEPA